MGAEQCLPQLAAPFPWRACIHLSLHWYDRWREGVRGVRQLWLPTLLLANQLDRQQEVIQKAAAQLENSWALCASSHHEWW